jgi:hypothetical protein
MGTRSTYRVIEEWKDDTTGKISQNKLVLMYAQYDGYPTGHPMDTAKWLASGKVVNGYGANEKKLVFNGAGCLAAQLVAKFKDSVGGYYIHPMNHRGQCWENYTYDIIIKEDKSIEYICYEIGGSKKITFKKLFQGSPEDFIQKYHEEEVEA